MFKSLINHLQSQDKPFPLYPFLHVQVKLPGMFIHKAFGSQLLVLLLLHSSISASIHIYDRESSYACMLTSPPTLTRETLVLLIRR